MKTGSVLQPENINTQRDSKRWTQSRKFIFQN